MPGVWKKTLTYLGLVEDEEFEEIDEVSVQPETTAEVRRFQRPQAVREVRLEAEHEGIVRTIPRPAPPPQVIHNRNARSTEARICGLVTDPDLPAGTIARRIVDSPGSQLDGKIEMVANRVYLLTPANVDVSAEDRERIAGGDIYNQF
jgi:cell division inhibitor SepF